MLELKNLSFSVEENGKQKEILHDLNLKIDNSRFVVITGPNGSGKSTLAKLIMGIEKPTSGQIIFDGEDITELSITERAKRGISFAFQQPVRFKGIRVHDLLRLAAGKDITIAEACNYLSEVGLCARDYIEREINSSLSGGSTLPSRAVSSRELKSQRCSRARQSSAYLTSLRQALTSGASKTLSAFLRICRRKSRTAQSSLSHIRKEFFASPTKSFCSLAALSKSKAASRIFFPN